MQEGQARELLRNLADFRETMVREVMTPRPDIIAIESDATIEQLCTLFREQQYSRMPVFKETLDNVVRAFVFIKDLIQRGPATTVSGPITPFIRPAHFVPETKRVPDLLKEFQRKRLQIAIVVDEYGGTAGLVTVEDLLEEIVGEIRDEYDVEVERIVDEGQRQVPVQRQRARRRDGQPDEGRPSKGRASRPSAASCCRASAACRRSASISRSTASTSRSSRPSSAASRACA